MQERNEKYEDKIYCLACLLICQVFGQFQSIERKAEASISYSWKEYFIAILPLIEELTKGKRLIHVGRSKSNCVVHGFR